MAIQRGIKTGVETEVNVEQATAAQNNLEDMFVDDQRTDNGEQFQDLISLDSILISDKADGEVLEDAGKAFLKGIESKKIDVKIATINKDAYDLGYSFVLMYYKGSNGKVYYFMSLLEATGRAPVTVKQIIAEMNIKNSIAILVTSDAFNDYLYEQIEKTLRKEFNDAPLVSLEGVVIPTDANIETTCEIIAKYGHDLIALKELVETGKARDITAADIRKVTSNSNLTLDVIMNTGLTINKLGRTVRTDFNVETNVVRNGNVRDFHGTNSRKMLATTAGYLEYIISEDVIPYTQQIKRTAKPMIILNEFLGKAPTMGYTLLSLINAATFTNRQQLSALIIEKDAGPLNYLFNYKGDGAGFGDKLSFKDPKAKPEIINDIIRTHISSSPIFAVEVELYGASYSYMTPFVGLSIPSATQRATNDILSAAERLVGSKFETNAVAANEGFLVPIGNYVDADGNTRDIREIDTTFIAKYTNEPALIFEWIFSNLPSHICESHTGKQPYILKLEVIDKIATILNLQVTITGKAVRVPLHGRFVEELVQKAMAAGYAPSTEGNPIGYNDFNNLQFVAQAYNGASVSNTGFAAQQMGSAGFMGNFNNMKYRG